MTASNAKRITTDEDFDKLATAWTTLRKFVEEKAAHGMRNTEHDAVEILEEMDRLKEQL